VRPVLGVVRHQQARAGYIPGHCLPALSEISDKVGNQKFIFIRNEPPKVMKAQGKVGDNF